MTGSDSNKRFEELAEKWLNGTITAEEKKEFSDWYNAGQDRTFHVPEDFVNNEQEHKARILKAINKKAFKVDSRPFLQSWAAAAAIVILLAAGAYYFSLPSGQSLVNRREQPAKADAERGVRELSARTREAAELASQIPAASNKAILTLSDGTKIVLDDTRNGFVAKQGGNSISKTANGELIYTFSKDKNQADATENEELFNTIETPKGGKFIVVLPDGSKVWLNAASSLRFPATFAGSKRGVKLTGEAYFEVAHDESKIFEVSTPEQTVQVLGTHFNINAYSDEPFVNTTLLQGSVRVSDLQSNTFKILKPGEQAILKEKIEVLPVKNTENAVAWKEGYFQFDDSDIKSVMRQLERWYDISVRYEGSLPSHRFGGEIERSLTLAQVLKILEKASLHYRLEGREVVVME